MRFKISLIILLLLGSLLLIQGCGSGVQGTYDINKATDKISCENSPTKNTIWFNSQCWYDRDKDTYPDDLVKNCPNTPCNIEKEYCSGESKLNWQDCVIVDGCPKLIDKGIIPTHCGIECITDKNCKSDEKCVIFNYKCEKDMCGDGICGEYEQCGKNNFCREDCLNEGQVCCNNNLLDGNCCSDESCDGENQCIENKCVLYCGDEILKENQICCEGIIKEGSCEEQKTNETQINQTTGNETL